LGSLPLSPLLVRPDRPAGRRPLPDDPQRHDLFDRLVGADWMTDGADHSAELRNQVATPHPWCTTPPDEGLPRRGLSA
jgi:hypothetical protein